MLAGWLERSFRAELDALVREESQETRLEIEKQNISKGKKGVDTWKFVPVSYHECVDWALKFWKAMSLCIRKG